MTPDRRSPSRGAWIETAAHLCLLQQAGVAPPRGERGLKLYAAANALTHAGSLPLAGSVD